MRIRFAAAAALVSLCLFASAVMAQTPATASLRVTVLDETDSALVTAAVTLVDPAGSERQAVADERGVAAFDGLVPGTYQVTVTMDGFRTYAGTASLRRGANQTTTRLAVALQEAIVVNDEGAESHRDNGFTTTLSQAEVDALSDDPDEMADQLQQMAGTGGQIFVDGFGGARLPPKDQIQQIRFHTNSYSAQYHDTGMVRIEVITKPGLGGWRGRVNFGFRDDSLNARNAKAPTLGPEQQRRFQFDYRGPLAKGRTSLSVRGDGNSAYDSQTIVAQTLDGSLNGLVRRPTDGLNVNVRLDHALSPTSQLQAEYYRRNTSSDNLGVGDFDLTDRAYESDSVTDGLRLRHTRVVGTKAFSELKVQLSRTEMSQASASDAPAIQVLDAFTSGGAGVAGTRVGEQLQVEQNVDFTVGKHALHAGVLFEGGWWDSTQQSNVNGTFTFSSLADFAAGLPRTYTRRLGDPEVSYAQFDAGWYVQDDFRLHKNLSLSLGLRQEIQTNYGDPWNLAPRAAFTWNLDKKTTVRGGFGIFYDWFEATVYEQTLQVDGQHQLDEVIVNPTYPVPTGAAGEQLPASRIQLADDLTQPLIRQASIGMERQLTAFASLRADYMWTRGTHTLRSVNVNAPLADGTRPDPTAGNINEIRSDGRRASDRVTVGLNLRAPRGGFFGNVMYTWSTTRNFADSPLSLPSNSVDPDVDWGPSGQDIRHRLFVLASAPLPFGVRAGLNVQMQSAAPYTITTGTDDNGDTVFNDRPAGVGRNSARGDAQINVGLRLNRSFNLGGASGGGGPMGPGGGPPPAAQRGPGGGPVGPGGPGGGGPRMMMMEGGATRYRLDLYAQVFNLLNTTNLNGYVGNLLSPYYGTATAAAAARRIEVGASISF